MNSGLACRSKIHQYIFPLSIVPIISFDQSFILLLLFEDNAHFSYASYVLFIYSNSLHHCLSFLLVLALDPQNFWHGQYRKGGTIIYLDVASAAFSVVSNFDILIICMLDIFSLYFTFCFNYFLFIL